MSDELGERLVRWEEQLKAVNEKLEQLNKQLATVLQFRDDVTQRVIKLEMTVKVVGLIALLGTGGATLLSKLM